MKFPRKFNILSAKANFSPSIFGKSFLCISLFIFLRTFFSGACVKMCFDRCWGGESWHIFYFRKCFNRRNFYAIEFKIIFLFSLDVKFLKFLRKLIEIWGKFKNVFEFQRKFFEFQICVFGEIVSLMLTHKNVTSFRDKISSFWITWQVFTRWKVKFIFKSRWK